LKIDPVGEDGQSLRLLLKSWLVPISRQTLNRLTVNGCHQTVYEVKQLPNHSFDVSKCIDYFDFSCKNDCADRADRPMK
jgi:hypothetical protein